jgi:hypothetical protein
VLSDIVIPPHSPRGSVPSKGELNSSAGTSPRSSIIGDCAHMHE